MTQINIKDIINTVILGDCVTEMKTWPDNSIDAIVCDPPAGISFMGQFWDTFDRSMFGKKGEEGANDLKVKKNFDILPRYGNADLMGFQDFICSVFIEAIRVLKPGGHALVWAIPRTSHHTAMGLERAGFEIRDICTHIFSTGFPKSLNIGKAVAKLRGEKIKRGKLKFKGGSQLGAINDDNWKPKDVYDEKVDNEWAGYGTALKPASEHWILCRKPISEKNVALNVLKWGVGGINIDGCRIGFGNESDNRIGTDFVSRGGDAGNNANDNQVPNEYYVQMYKSNGRFPSNLILECTCDEVLMGADEVVSVHDGPAGTLAGGDPDRGSIKNYRSRSVGKSIIHTNPACPCYMLDRQSGKLNSGDNCIRSKEGFFGEHGGLGKAGDVQTTYGDSGGASRFFYHAKASKSERNIGCELLDDKPITETKGNGLSRVCDICGASQLKPCSCENNSWILPAKNKNNHPTVKNLELMRYLCRMICPAQGIVLDPFAGSGSTLIAAKLEGFNFIGIEKEPEYHKIALARLKAWKYQRQESLF